MQVPCLVAEAAGGNPRAPEAAVEHRCGEAGGWREKGIGWGEAGGWREKGRGW
jgi:hypothetical protein